MYVKIQGGGKNPGVYANTGSCAALVEYLEHEDKERLAEGLEVHEFFNGLGLDVTRGEVLQKIDRNHKKLRYSDAKFYHLDINPSQNELRAMGSTNEEIIANCKILAVKLTELYARNFSKQIIEKDKEGNEVTRPLSGKDIMIFWKVHETRDEKEGLQIHIHGIPSRKDIHNKYQLSPVTNHKGTSKGPVTGGFERTRFYQEVENVFDETFKYDRRPDETFEYYLEKKKERKAAEKVATMINELDREKGIEMSAPETKIKDALAKREQRRRNEFWNDYHSKYRPMYNELKTSCDNSFSMYKEAKEQYGICSMAISDRYTQLKGIYAEMNARHNDIVAAKTAKSLWKAASAFVFFLNPIAGIVMGLAGSIVAETSISSDSAARKTLGAQAAGIRKSIEDMKAEQAELRQNKADRLKIYVENKEAKTNLQREINYLKSALDGPKMRYIVHSRTDATVYPDAWNDWRHPESTKICNILRQRLVNEGYFVGWGVDTFENDLQQKKVNGDTAYRSGYLELQDGAAVLHQEIISGNPELTKPALANKTKETTNKTKKHTPGFGLH